MWNFINLCGLTSICQDFNMLNLAVASGMDRIFYSFITSYTQFHKFLWIMTFFPSLSIFINFLGWLKDCLEFLLIGWFFSSLFSDNISTWIPLQLPPCLTSIVENMTKYRTERITQISSTAFFANKTTSPRTLRI